MDINFNYDNFLIMDCEKFLSISHCFFPVSLCKNRIMLSVWLTARGLHLGLDPLLFQSLDDAREIFPKHLAQLPLDFAPDEGLNNGYQVERVVDVDILKWVCHEDQSDTLCFETTKTTYE